MINFLDNSHGFYSSAKDQVDVLVEMHKNMTTMYKELVEYFCLDVKKTTMEEFFGDIKTFLDFFEVQFYNYGRQPPLHEGCGGLRLVC